MLATGILILRTKNWFAIWQLSSIKPLSQKNTQNNICIDICVVLTFCQSGWDTLRAQPWGNWKGLGIIPVTMTIENSFAKVSSLDMYWLFFMRVEISPRSSFVFCRLMTLESSTSAAAFRHVMAVGNTVLSQIIHRLMMEAQWSILLLYHHLICRFHVGGPLKPKW